MFPPNSHFSYNPHLRAPRAPRETPKPQQYPKPIEIPPRVLGDWMHQLRTAAAEAGDADLLALESDLIGLHDEMSRYW